MKMPKRKRIEEPTEVREVPLPGPGEVLGIVIQMLGGDKVRVKCVDGILDCAEYQEKCEKEYG